MSDAVVFVTDYGADDTYAAALVGAIWGVEPTLRCVSGTHAIAAGDVLAAAYHVKAIARAFPQRTVVCAIVDPGVGTARRAIAVDTGRVRCVAPDNGLISYLWAEAKGGERRCVALPIPESASATFHGRDVFAPVAARLATGAGVEDCGTAVDAPVLLAGAFCVAEVSGLVGRVIAVDHFGNAITSIRDIDLGGRRPLQASWERGGARAAVAVRTYADIGEGLAVLVGSAGHLEIAANGRPAATLGGPRRGQVVRVEGGGD